MQATDTLRNEHLGVLTVLDHLDRAAAAAERGARVPTDVFADIQEFFSVFVDRCHHGKEELEVFPRLIPRGPAGLVQRLEADHTRGRQLAAAYASAARAYDPGQVEAGRRLAAAARDYAAFLREHIALETEELFPAMESALAPDDRALSEAFERLEVERIGPGTHERLHGMIDGLGPRIDPWTTARGH
ncbi:MAG: hemerythrin domain-containing protein [Chloroflexi bacterium]|nr:hemerythrin domain-containing protein [Chloroflexota bacterium]